MMKKYYYIFLLVFQFSMSPLFAQNNTYTAITSPSTLVANSTTSFTVNSATSFAIGNKVLIIQMKGTSIETTDNSNYGDITSIGNAGNYEFAIISNISGNDITLENCLINDYDLAGKVQMVSVPQYTNHTINTTLVANESWEQVNPGTGGVLVFEVSGTLTLNANISADGSGFAGGEISDNNTTNCAFDPLNYVLTTANEGAEKGESIVITTPYRGRGKVANGGGGGNAFEAGGGGGGNAGSGGLGGYGKEHTSFVIPFPPFPTICGGVNSSSIHLNKHGIGGVALDTYFSSDKIFLGGGGGGGQATNNTLGFPAATAGGNGGGIIIIRANEIVGNSYTISANGVSAGNAFDTSLGLDGLGGGGAGGTILLEVNTYTGNLNLEAKGGNGGTATSGDGNRYAGGGGGGGGFIWISGTDIPSMITGLSVDVSGGAKGQALLHPVATDTGTATQKAHGASDGGNGQERNSLVIPEKGKVLSGSYTIGGTTPDYANLELAIDDLLSYGIRGDVVFNIRSGTYTESTDLEHEITNFSYQCGASAANSITIQSESGIATDVLLETSSTSSFGLSILGVENVIINNLTIQNTQAPPSPPNTFQNAFKVDDNSTVTLHNVLITGTCQVLDGSTLTCTGTNEITNGHLEIEATLNNQGTLRVGKNLGGNIVFNAMSATLTNTGSNEIYLEGKTWIENVVGATFTPNTGTVHLNSTSLAQEIQGGNGTNQFYNLTINNTNGVTLNTNHSIDNLLTLTNGLLTTGTNTIFFNSMYPESNNPSESSSSRIIGNAQMNTKTVGTGTLNFLGVNITGSDNIGDVVILRTTGTDGIQLLPSANESIACTWDIQVTQQPATSRNITFSWLSDLDNSNAPVASQVWKNTSGTWNTVGAVVDASGTPRLTPSIVASSFSEWTVNSINISLSVDNIQLEGTRIDNKTNLLSWQVPKIAQEQITDFVLFKSYDGITYTFLSNVSTNILHQYSYQDSELKDVYYKVLAIDFENSIKFESNIVYLKSTDSSYFLKIFPNPFYDVVSIESNITPEKTINAILLNTKGAILARYNAEFAGFESWLQTQTKNIKKGVFILDIMIENKHIYRKIIKQ